MRSTLFRGKTGLGLQVWILCIAGTLLVHAQTPVDLGSEPHHTLLFKNDHVRVFEATLRPTEKAFARYQNNFLMITLHDSEMVMWVEGQADVMNFRFNEGDTRFFFGGATRGMRNDRTTTYKNITVEFMNPKVTTYGYQPALGSWQYGGSVIAPPVDPHKKFKSSLRLGEANASQVQLLQGDVLEPPDQGVAELIIPITDIDLKAEADRHIRKSAGDVIWLGAGRTTNLMNADIDPARFIVVELMPAKN